MKIRAFSILAILLISTISISAQKNFFKNKMDKYLKSLEENNKAMLGLAIAKDGKIIYDNYIGFASKSDNIQNSEKTIFRIGSISKVFTSTMIFQLIEEGVLSLDTKLAEFFPDVKNSKIITISNLLNHRSGIHNFTNDPDYFNYNTEYKSKAEMLVKIAKLDSDFEPGTEASYSNSNYVLLGYIIEEITNSTYTEQLNERIISKIGLSSTNFGKKIDVKSNDAESYSFEENNWIKSSETDMSIPHGAGAVVSSPIDLCKFIYALFNGNLVSDESLSKMKEIHDNYGRGLFQYPFYDKKGFGHNGGIDGFHSHVSYFPEDNLSLSVTANGLNYNMNDILIGALSIYFNRDFEIPDFSKKPVELKTETLEKYTGKFVSEQLPLDITLMVEDGKLYGQATGQSAFLLTPYSEKEFRFSKAGIVILFEGNDKIDYNKFVFHQGRGKFNFTKK